MNDVLPVLVIGAGPVGLAAAAHLLERGLEPLVLEAGPVAGANLLDWGHVRMFSPWQFDVDGASRRLLDADGWSVPDPDAFPTGRELAERYVQPLAATTALAPRLRLGARVVAVTRQRHDRMKDAGRDQAPLLVRYEDADGEHDLLAMAVVDASGTLRTPNPLGAAGLPALGERDLGDAVFYGMPDVLGAQRGHYAGKRVLVVGSGHSAFNVLNDLARLADEAPGTEIVWALRRPSIRRVLGGGENDQLKERGRLGLAIGRLVEQGRLTVASGFLLERLRRTGAGIVASSGDTTLPPVDRVIACTGFRPDERLLSELRLDLDPGTGSPRALAPLIDPNLHSCGSVRPHGADELKHPDAGVYIVGMKSYGRAPTFLLLTGYEQVRSVAAAIAGDWDAARRVELQLPETGVCITQFADEAPAQASSCCGGPSPDDDSACCVRDAGAKAAGQGGCGCGQPSADMPAPAAACCA